MRRSLLVALALLPAAAAAQSLPTETRAVLALGEQPVRLTSTFGTKGKVELRVGKAKAATLDTGEAAAALVAGHGKLVVGIATDADAAPLCVVAITAPAARGAKTCVARPGSRTGDHPFAVAGTATATGFTLFFQEVQGDDPTAAHTYMLALDAEGAPSGAAREIAVPWALAGAIATSTGYHLALMYAGDGGRLSMVGLDASGAPQQHPDWASPVGFFGEVHLVATATGITAIYRGGKGADRILASDVTAIRSWGSEPPAPKDLGAIGAAQLLAVDSDGKPRKLAR